MGYAEDAMNELHGTDVFTEHRRQPATHPRPVPPRRETGLTIRDFQAISVKRALLWHKDKPWTPDQWLTAFIGELGEFANELKKHSRDRDGLRSNNPRRVSLAKELADSFAYFVLLCDSVGVDLESETITVFNSISEREGFDIRIERQRA